MDDKTKTLKLIAIQALQALFTSDNEPTIRVTHTPDIGKNTFIFTFGAPENDDLGDADEPYLSLLVDVEPLDNGEFNCQVVQPDIINNPEEKTLIRELYREKFKRDLREPPNEEDEI